MKRIWSTAAGLCLPFCATAAAPELPALYEAVEARDPARIESLLKAADAPPACDPDKLLTHPLTAAIVNRDVPSTKLLLDAGTCKGQLEILTPFVDRSPKVLAVLLDHGLPVNTRVFNTPMAAMAARDADLEALNLLLARGADITLTDDQGNTALMLATGAKRESRVAIIDLLLARGVDPKAHNRDGESALHGAAREADAATMKLLLARGLSMEERNKAGISAWGFLYSNPKALALEAEYPPGNLSEADRLYAVATAIDNRGFAVAQRFAKPGEVKAHPEWLRQAHDRQDFPALAWLLAHGADPSVTDSDGKPLLLERLADDGSDTQIASRVLIAAGGRVPAQLPEEAGWMWLDRDCLEDALCVGWLRLAGLSLRTRVGEKETLAEVLRGDDGKITGQKFWTQPLPASLRQLRPSFGPAWRARRAELVGTWADAEGDNLWSFAGDGSYTRHLKMMFVEDRSRGRWEQVDGGLHLKATEHSAGAMVGESNKGSEQTLMVLMWLGDELMITAPFGSATLKKTSPKPRDLAGPSIASLTPEAACTGAGERLTKATGELRGFLEAAENKEPTPQRQALEKLANLETPPFVAECRRDYATKPEMKRFAQCLLTTDTWLSLLGCIGIAQDPPKP